MALMLGKLYDALRAGNVPEKEAREASEEVASYERDIAGPRTELRVVQGVGGVLSVIVLAVLWQLFALKGEVAAGFASVTATLNSVERRLGTIEGRLDQVGQRTEGGERRLPPP